MNTSPRKKSFKKLRILSNPTRTTNDTFYTIWNDSKQPNEFLNKNAFLNKAACTSKVISYEIIQ